MIDINNIYKVFEGFTSHSDDYMGAMFINIYKSLPYVYYIYFDNSNNIKYRLKSKQFNYRKEIKINIDACAFLNNAIDENNDFIKVFCYSSNEWLIISLYDYCKFLINITYGEFEENTNKYYLTVYTDNIENTINEIKKWCVPAQKNAKIEFGIAAVDVSNSLYTSWYEYEHKQIDIEKNYNNDIPYNKICSLIDNDGQSGLILFYGEPGTGKSSLIKHLISKYKEIDFVFIDGSLLANSSQVKLMSYFLENQNTVFILEDCEKILLDREHNYNPAMSLLLNITDGTLSDVLGIKIICTFNTALNKIDKALLRKGRLSLKYEFKKLTKEKVRKILNDNTIDKDMTLADIYNIDDENDFSQQNTKKIGF